MLRDINTIQMKRVADTTRALALHYKIQDFEMNFVVREDETIEVEYMCPRVHYMRIERWIDALLYILHKSVEDQTNENFSYIHTYKKHGNDYLKKYVDNSYEDDNFSDYEEEELIQEDMQDLTLFLTQY